MYTMYTDIVPKRDEPEGSPEYLRTRERIMRRNQVAHAWMQRNGINPYANTESSIARAMPLFAEYTRRNPTLCFMFANARGETRVMYCGELTHYPNFRAASDAMSWITALTRLNLHMPRNPDSQEPTRGPPPAAR